MKTLEITNPQIVADVLSRHFIDLPPDKLAKTLTESYERNLEFSRTDDASFCCKLNREQLDEYSMLVDSFKIALKRVTALVELGGREVLISRQAIPLVANLLAWRQVLSMFKTLYG